MATRADESAIYDELRGTPKRPQKGWTWAKLLEFHADDPRHEIIDGELIVTAAPTTRHQLVSQRLAVTLHNYMEEHGGLGLGLPVNEYFSERDVIEPDCVYVRPENMSRVDEIKIVGPPDLLIEISSPSTRRLDLVRKRDLYERNGVPEYWFVDLDSDNVQVYRFIDGSYAEPHVVGFGDVIEPPHLPGFSVAIDELLAPFD